MPLTDAVIENIIQQYISDGHLGGLNQLSPDKQQILYKQLIEHCIKIKCWFMVARLWRSDNESFAQGVELLDDSTDKSILSICMQRAFSESLCFAEFSVLGRLKYEHALNACAAIKGDAKDWFNPIIIQTRELERFLITIKDNIATLNAKQINFLIIEDDHWFAVAMQLGKIIRLFLIDSLGPGKVQSTNAYQMMQEFLQAHFKESAHIFLNNLTTQNSNGTCQMFAFDYLRKICRIPHIFALLPEGSMFVDLPLPLMRSAQISNLQKVISLRPEYDPNEIINKKGETMDSAVARNFINQFRNGKERRTNIYLEHKHQNLRRKAITYLANSTLLEQRRATQNFTVDNFVEKFDQNLRALQL